MLCLRPASDRPCVLCVFLQCRIKFSVSTCDQLWASAPEHLNSPFVAISCFPHTHERLWDIFNKARPVLMQITESSQMRCETHLQCGTLHSFMCVCVGLDVVLFHRLQSIYICSVCCCIDRHPLRDQYAFIYSLQPSRGRSLVLSLTHLCVVADTSPFSITSSSSLPRLWQTLSTNSSTRRKWSQSCEWEWESGKWVNHTEVSSTSLTELQLPFSGPGSVRCSRSGVNVTHFI